MTGRLAVLDAMMALRPGGGSYADKVLALGPLAYWPLWEASGTVSAELVAGRNGSYNSVTLGQPGIGDGRTAARVDAGGYVGIYSAGLGGVFNGQLGSVAMWAQVPSGMWTDGVLRNFFQLRGGADIVSIAKRTTNNTLLYVYNAGGVSRSHAQNGVSSAAWMHLAVTWNLAADQFVIYYNGALLTTITGLGTWAAALASTTTVVGAATSSGGSVLVNGLVAHFAMWNRALGAAEVAGLAVV